MVAALEIGRPNANGFGEDQGTRSNTRRPDGSSGAFHPTRASGPLFEPLEQEESGTTVGFAETWSAIAEALLLRVATEAACSSSSVVLPSAGNAAAPTLSPTKANCSGLTSRRNALIRF